MNWMYLWFFPDVIHFIDLFECNLVLKKYSLPYIPILVFRCCISNLNIYYLFVCFCFKVIITFDIQIKIKIKITKSNKWNITLNWMGMMFIFCLFKFNSIHFIICLNILAFLILVCFWCISNFEYLFVYFVC